ncbi:hypothetical protein DPMN_102665 [Dreissena polymorpha]|uniref:Uncharacterized protein n=1 Tax=Dreissena polymorpha TaxID=45954 RepID=A0A9D4R9A1_DREPO|nr:hypothetical protein DPMN_102665 [Dreissena polymorpha]
MTVNIDRRLYECAWTLNGGKLLATLSGGDAVAQELKYHKNVCPLCTTGRKLIGQDLMTRRTAIYWKVMEDEVYPLVFSELVTCIVESKSKATDPIVFCPADLVKMFKQRLEQFGVSPLMSTVHSTRLKYRLLAEIPEIEAHESGRDTVLAFKSFEIL